MRLSIGEAGPPMISLAAARPHVDASIRAVSKAPLSRAVFLRRPDLGSVQRDLVVGAARGAGEQEHYLLVSDGKHFTVVESLPGACFGRLARNTGLCRDQFPSPAAPGLYPVPGLDFTGPSYVSNRLSAPRDGATRAGTGGLDGFRIMPVVPSSDTSASG